LCQLRGLNLGDMKVNNELGEKPDFTQTVGDANLMFLELVDKKEKKKDKKKDDEHEDGGKKLQKGIPDGIKIELGKPCLLPLRDQLFTHEWQALQDLKTNYEICKNYSDEFLMACLFSRKLDLIRSHTLLQTNWKWRKENGLTELPRYSDFNLDAMLQSWIIIPGARAKDGTGLVFIEIANIEIGKEPFTIPTMMKWISWYYYIGIFMEGMDYFRNGITMVEDLEGMGWKHFDIDFQRKMSSIWTDTFPMRVKKVLVLNPPVIFEALMKIVKTFMKAKIIDRFAIVSQKEVSKSVSKDVAPVKFGGTNTTSGADTVKLFTEWAKVHEDRLRK